MSFLFANTSLRGHSMLGLVTRYGFCNERRRYGDNKFGNNSIVGKLLTKGNVKDILSVYQDSKAQFGSEQYAIACRTMAKNLSNERVKSGAITYDNLPQFTEGLDNAIGDMNPSELLDVLFLLRKQKTLHVNIYFPKNRNTIIDKVNAFVRQDVYSVRNLIALIFNLSYLGYTSFQAVDTLLTKIQDPEGDVTKEVTIFSASQLIRGLTNNKLILNGKQKRLVHEVLVILQKNYQTDIDVPSAINILGSVSRINIGEGMPFPFTRKLVQKIEASFQSMGESDIFMLLRIAEHTNQKLMVRPCLELKKVIMDLMGSDHFYFDVSFVIRILTTMSNWLQLQRFTPQEQEVIVKYLENPNNKLKDYHFVRSQPVFLKLLNRENANTLAHIILANPQGVSISTLATLGRYTDVVPRLIETQLKKQNFSLHELLRIQEIIQGSNKALPKQLQALSQNIPQQIKQKLSENNSWGHVRTFLKQTPKASIGRISQAVKQYILSMDELTTGRMFRRAEFLFVVIAIWGRDRDLKFTEKLRQIGMNQAISRKGLKTLASFLGQSSTSYALEFWRFCTDVEIRSHSLANSLDSTLFYKTLKNSDSMLAYSNWLVQCLKNQVEIDRHFTNLILLTVESCKIASINKRILDCFLSNVEKVNKYDRGTIMRLVTEIKREGLMDLRAQTKLLTKFQFLKDLNNYFINADRQDDKKSQALHPKTKQFNRNDVERILFADFEKWSDLKEKVIEVIESSDTNYVSTWRNWLSSLRPEMRKNKHYREVSDLVMRRFITSLETSHLYNQNIGLLRFVQLNNPSIIKAGLIDKLLEKAKNNRDNFMVETILDVLSNTGSQKMLDICLIDGQVSRQKMKHLARYNINVPLDQQMTLAPFLQVPSNGIIKRDVLESLALNDHLPKVDAFLTENKDLIKKTKVPYTTRNYFESKFGQKVDLTKYGRKNDKQNKVSEKIQESANQAGLDFELNPVVEGVKFDFRIQDKYVLLSKQSRFFNLNSYDSKESLEKLDLGLTLSKRILEKQLNKKVLIIPGSFNAFFVLQRQFPQLKNQNTQKRAEEIPDSLGADEDVKSNAGQAEDLNVSDEQLDNDSLQTDRAESANRSHRNK